MLNLSKVPFKPYYEKDGIVIYNADCRQVLPFLPKFDLLLTDPPYGISVVTQFRNAKKSGKSIFAKSRNVFHGPEWDKSAPTDELIETVTAAAIQLILWGANYYNNTLANASKMLVWDKMNGTNNMADVELAWTNIKGQSRMFRMHHFSKGSEPKQHPTQKPVPLMVWCMKHAGEFETILDPFMGSGTTLVAAKQEGKKAVGIELEERYCEVAVNRLAQNVLFGDVSNEL